MAERTHSGFRALRGIGARQQQAGGKPAEQLPTPRETVSRRETGLPERPRPAWWPEESKSEADTKAAHTAAQSEDEATMENEEANLHVGRGLRLKGEVSSCDRLTVEGDVEAAISARVLEISRSGRVKGEAQVEAASIDGHYEGTLKVSGCLSVRGSGRISGTVEYAALEVEKGGCIIGEINRTEGTDAAKPAAPVRPVAVPDEMRKEASVAGKSA